MKVLSLRRNRLIKAYHNVNNDPFLSHFFCIVIGIFLSLSSPLAYIVFVTLIHTASIDNINTNMSQISSRIMTYDGGFNSSEGG
jgi:protein-S-isoprenylcysteine O-methyltransferase Ste14